MAKFEFFIDQKETVWRRNYCEIEAETEEEAISLMKKTAFDFDYDRFIDISDIISETYNDMEYDENGYNPTREIYYKNVRIEDNTPISVKRNQKINTIINEEN